STPAQYERMGETGILADDPRIELIAGQIVVREPIGAEPRAIRLARLRAPARRHAAAPTPGLRHACAPDRHRRAAADRGRRRQRAARSAGENPALRQGRRGRGVRGSARVRLAQTYAQAGASTAYNAGAWRSPSPALSPRGA